MRRIFGLSWVLLGFGFGFGFGCLVWFWGFFGRVGLFWFVVLGAEGFLGVVACLVGWLSFLLFLLIALLFFLVYTEWPPKKVQCCFENSGQNPSLFLSSEQKLPHCLAIEASGPRQNLGANKLRWEICRGFLWELYFYFFFETVGPDWVPWFQMCVWVTIPDQIM